MPDLTVSSSVDTFMAAANQAAMLAALNITLGGAFATSGAFTTTLTVTGNTNVTLPTSGTLAILGANTFTGAQTVPAGSVASPGILFSGVPGYGIMALASSRISIVGNGAATLSLGASVGSNSKSGAFIYPTWALGWLGGADPSADVVDLMFFRKAAATLQLGQDAAGVTNQMFTAASRITSDGVGANLTIAGGNGRGGAGGSLILSTYDTQATGTIGNLVTRLTITTTGLTTFSGAIVSSVNGAASTPALSGVGTIFTGGSATTTKPYWLIEPTGTTSTNWSTSGTLLGINAPSGFTGHLQSWQVNGVSYGHINTTGLILGATALTPNYLFVGSATGTLGFVSSTLIEPTADGTLKLSNYARTGFNRLMFGGSTSSFPALKRSTTTLQCRLADDSAYAQFDALGYSVGGAAGASGTVTAASTVTVVNGIITVIV